MKAQIEYFEESDNKKKFPVIGGYEGSLKDYMITYGCFEMHIKTIKGLLMYQRKRTASVKGVVINDVNKKTDIYVTLNELEQIVRVYEYLKAGY